MSGSHPTRWIVFLLSGALSVLGCVGDTDSPSGETGSLSLDLVIGDGIVINEVDWRITGNDMDMDDTINVSAPGSTASVEVFGLPPGDEDYTVMLTATSVDEEVTCKGSTDFNVEVGETTDVKVILNCKLPRRFGSVRVNGEFNICAELVKMVVSPLVTSIGNDIDLQSQAIDRDGDDITTLWSNDGGVFDDPTAESTTYTCLEVGIHLITVSVTDSDKGCDMATWTVPIECVGGDGGLCEINICDEFDTECNHSVCDPETGACVDKPINEDDPCEDGTGTCEAGECVDKCLDVTCDDLGECIANECGPLTGICMESNLDGEFCEDKTGVCKDGACIITDLCEINICDEFDTECNDSVCDPENGECVDKPINEEDACDDGTGTCLAGECVDNCLDVTCDDLGECIANECNPLTASCEKTNLDGEPCENETGVCMGGECIVTDLCEVNICDENDTECNNSMCEPSTGNCVDTPINEEDPCDDGTGICLAGECIPVECIEDTDCEVGQEICFENECRGDPDLFCDEGLCAESPSLKAECMEGFLVCLAENPVDEECVVASFLFCAECVADAGCDEGFVCDDNVCIAAELVASGTGTQNTRAVPQGCVDTNGGAPGGSDGSNVPAGCDPTAPPDDGGCTAFECTLATCTVALDCSTNSLGGPTSVCEPPLGDTTNRCLYPGGGGAPGSVLGCQVFVTTLSNQISLDTKIDLTATGDGAGKVQTGYRIEATQAALGVLANAANLVDMEILTDFTTALPGQTSVKLLAEYSGLSLGNFLSVNTLILTSFGDFPTLDNPNDPISPSSFPTMDVGFSGDFVLTLFATAGDGFELIVDSEFCTYTSEEAPVTLDVEVAP